MAIWTRMQWFNLLRPEPKVPRRPVRIAAFLHDARSWLARVEPSSRSLPDKALTSVATSTGSPLIAAFPANCACRGRVEHQARNQASSRRPHPLRLPVLPLTRHPFRRKDGRGRARPLGRENQFHWGRLGHHLRQRPVSPRRRPRRQEHGRRPPLCPQPRARSPRREVPEDAPKPAGWPPIASPPSSTHRWGNLDAEHR